MPQGSRSHDESHSGDTGSNSSVHTSKEGQGAPPESEIQPDCPTVSLSDAQTSAQLSPELQAGGSKIGKEDHAIALSPGMILAGRYHILKVLGRGGMGAVYKAEDRELDRLVALKIIRPDLANDAGMLHRFKQEILLSSKITDRHIVRIFDLGEGNGFKFITMEFIEGRDLRTILAEQGKLDVADSVSVIRQVLQGLDSAHQQSIIHRDLKPANIMRDAEGRVVVMDFGVARTVAGDGMTGTGLVVGTMEYMSPEQAQALPLDARSDIFSVGLIFYELLTGKNAFSAESAIASLVKRTKERATPVYELDHSIPQRLSAIVSRCLETEPKARYQSVREVLADLERWQEKTLLALPRLHLSQLPVSGIKLWVGLGILVAALAGAGFLIRIRSRHAIAPATPLVTQPDISLAILPFRNSSNDATLDWLGSSLAEMLNTDIGQSGHLRTVSPEQIHQIVTDLRLQPGSAFDATTLHRIAQYSNSDTLVWGQYARFGDQIRIDVTIDDIKRGRQTPLRIEASGEKGIPDSIDRLAESIRQNLAISPDVMKELKASSFQPSSASMEALRQYQQGVQALREGKYLEAEKDLEGATSADASFALAFSRLAQCYSNLGYDDRAEQASRKAIALSSSLPASERYLISAVHATITKDFPKAISAYEDLVKAAPDNPELQFALAGAYEKTGDFAKASEHYQQVLTANPKDISGLLASGRVAILSGNSEASLDPLNHALSLAIQSDNQEQKALILQALGIAYASLNKPQDAIRNYEQSLEIKKRLGQKKGVADSLNMIAEAYDVLGKPELALTNYNSALKIYREIGDRQDVGSELLNLGQFYHARGKYDDALRLFKESLQILREVGDKNNEGICLNNIGSTYDFTGDYENARTYFEQALALEEKGSSPSDIADTVHNLGEVSMKTGQYDQALSYFVRALDLRRQANDQPGSAKESDSMGILFAYEGRYGAALKARKDAMNGFRNLQDRSYWMAETQAGYGVALAQVGDHEQSKTNLEESLGLAHELKNDSLSAQIMGDEGDAFLYQGDISSAQNAYERAAQMVSKSSDRNLQLELKIKLAELSLQKAPSRSSTAEIRHLADQAAAVGLKYSSIEASLTAAEALIKLKDYADSRQLLDNLLATSEKLGTRPLLARAHLLMATILRLTGNSSDANSEYRQAVQLIQTMQTDAGPKFSERSDIRTMLAEAEHWLPQS